MESHFDTPVAALIFNRPSACQLLIDAIREAKPSKPLIIADGPRPDRHGEREACEASRAIMTNVDWDCELETNFSEVNLGCKQRVSSGLDWVFDIAEEAIILEDDCIPHPSFFRYCRELLTRYRDDTRIMAISGNNFQPQPQVTPFSYYFSRYNHSWGPPGAVPGITMMFQWTSGPRFAAEVTWKTCFVTRWLSECGERHSNSSTKDCWTHGMFSGRLHVGCSPG